MGKNADGRLNRNLLQVHAWATDARPKKFERLDDYLDGQGRVGLASKDLFEMGMRQVDQSLLAAADRKWRQANQHMAFGFARMLIADAIGIQKLQGTNDDAIEDLDGCTHMMLGAIATGQPDLVKPFHRAVIAGLEAGYGVRDGHDLPIGTTLRYAAFGLSIIGSWLGEPLDLDKHALPRDPAWGQLVAHWREPDADKLLPVLLAACDTHVERSAVTDREADQLSDQFEFGSVFLAVHPTEILAVLRLRDLLGLPNPPQIDHPLMQTAYAAITCQPGEITERDELLHRFLTAVHQRDPQVLPQGL